MTNNIEIAIAALVMLAGNGKTKVRIPTEILDKAKRHIESGHTLMYGKNEAGDLEAVLWAFRKKSQKPLGDKPDLDLASQL